MLIGTSLYQTELFYNLNTGSQSLTLSFWYVTIVLAILTNKCSLSLQKPRKCLCLPQMRYQSALACAALSGWVILRCCGWNGSPMASPILNCWVKQNG